MITYEPFRWKGSSLKHHVEVVLAASDGTCCILREEDLFYKRRTGAMLHRFTNA
jgi:hypothetical protein